MPINNFLTSQDTQRVVKVEIPEKITTVTRNVSFELAQQVSRFLYLRASNGLSERDVSPSPVVDDVWHQLLLDTRHYQELCSLFGRICHENHLFIHHDSALARDGWKEGRYVRTLQLYQQTFGTPAPVEFWPRIDQVQAEIVQSAGELNQDQGVVRRSRRLKKQTPEFPEFKGHSKTTKTRSARSKGQIQVFVKNLKGKTIAIECRPNISIMGFKRKVQVREGIPPDQQRLIHAGRQMQDDKKISDYKIRMHSSIELVMGLRGC